MSLRKLILIISVFLSTLEISSAQFAFPFAGKDLYGADGTISYTAGQVSCIFLSGSGGTVAQGVQQSYDIAVVGVFSPDDLPVISIYPNPASGFLILSVEDPGIADANIAITYAKGALVFRQEIGAGESVISMDRLIAQTYFIAVCSGHRVLKVFKVVKI